MFVDIFSLNFTHYTITYSEQMLSVRKEVKFGCLTSYKMLIMFFFKKWLKSGRIYNSKCTQAFKAGFYQYFAIVRQ